MSVLHKTDKERSSCQFCSVNLQMTVFPYDVRIKRSRPFCGALVTLIALFTSKTGPQLKSLLNIADQTSYPLCWGIPHRPLFYFPLCLGCAYQVLIEVAPLFPRKAGPVGGHIFLQTTQFITRTKRDDVLHPVKPYFGFRFLKFSAVKVTARHFHSHNYDLD